MGGGCLGLDGDDRLHVRQRRVHVSRCSSNDRGDRLGSDRGGCHRAGNRRNIDHSHNRGNASDYRHHDSHHDCDDGADHNGEGLDPVELRSQFQREQLR